MVLSSNVMLVIIFKGDFIMLKKRKIMITYLLFILIGIIITIISLFRSYSMCMFYNYTSIPCPACGYIISIYIREN